MKIYLLANKEIGNTPDTLYESLNYKDYGNGAANNNILSDYDKALSFLADILKESDHDSYVGFCYGGYIFTRFACPLTETYLQYTLDDYDMILPYANPVKEASLCTQYQALVSSDTSFSSDDNLIINSLKNVINEFYPEYMNSFLFACNTKYTNISGMMIGKKSDILEYTNKIMQNNSEKYINTKFDKLVVKY